MIYKSNKSALQVVQVDHRSFCCAGTWYQYGRGELTLTSADPRRTDCVEPVL